MRFDDDGRRGGMERRADGGEPMERKRVRR